MVPPDLLVAREGKGSPVSFQSAQLPQRRQDGCDILLIVDVSSSKGPGPTDSELEGRGPPPLERLRGHHIQMGHEQFTQGRGPEGAMDHVVAPNLL